MRTTATKFTTVAAALALALGATLTLSGCFSNPIEGLVKEGIGGVIKEATGADVDLGGSVAVDGKKMWTIRLKVSGPNVFEDIQARFIGAGFEETLSASGMGVFQGHGYGVVVNLEDNRGDVALTYVVTEEKDGK